MIRALMVCGVAAWLYGCADTSAAPPADEGPVPTIVAAGFHGPAANATTCAQWRADPDRFWVRWHRDHLDDHAPDGRAQPDFTRLGFDEVMTDWCADEATP